MGAGASGLRGGVHVCALAQPTCVLPCDRAPRYGRRMGSFSSAALSTRGLTPPPPRRPSRRGPTPAKMPRGIFRQVLSAFLALATIAGCSGGTSGTTTTTNPLDGPPAGNPEGNAPMPREAQAEDVSTPTTVVGKGTPASCTGDAFVTAVATGGVITFDCGPAPLGHDRGLDHAKQPARHVRDTRSTRLLRHREAASPDHQLADPALSAITRPWRPCGRQAAPLPARQPRLGKRPTVRS
jgi:hypothetical protein